jgi:hypothetical protein
MSNFYVPGTVLAAKETITREKRKPAEWKKNLCQIFI